MVAKVAINALMRSLAMTMPLISPTTRPMANAADTPSTTLSVSRITIPATTPAQAITEPTDKSKCPEARQNNMVHAAMPTVEIARPSPRMFNGERKLSMSNAHSKKILTAANSMAQLSSSARRSRGLRAVGSTLC
ncbi:hypothetical protein PS682_05621 [Pseudomonas fluorescens]|nr:hypothetical protein PS682_05621 [Pseudomonas fluorescens]